MRIDAETGKIRVFRARRVVGEVEDEFTEMTVEQAHAHRHLLLRLHLDHPA